MTKCIPTQKGFIVDDSNDLAVGYPVFISTKNVEEIDDAFPFSSYKVIYGKKRIEQVINFFKKNCENFKDINDYPEINATYQKLCTAVEKNDEFWQEMADLDWEMERAIHYYR